MRYIIITALVLGLSVNLAFAGDHHRKTNSRPQHRNHHQRNDRTKKMVFDIGSLAIQLAQTIVENVKDGDDDKLYIYDENGKLKAVIDKDDLEDLKDNKKEERKVVVRYDWRFPDRDRLRNSRCRRPTPPRRLNFHIPHPRHRR